MKPFLWMTCAVLAACAIGFSAYRMLVGEASERIPATRLVVEADAFYLSTTGMVPLEDPFIFNTARNPAFELREGKAVSRWRNVSWKHGKRTFWTGFWTGWIPSGPCAFTWFAASQVRSRRHGWMTGVTGKTRPS